MSEALRGCLMWASGALVAIGCASMGYWAPAMAAPEPLLKPGQMYILVWSCFAPTGECYGEIVKVEAVREDGWADLISCGTPNGIPNCKSDRWRSNLDQVLSIQPYRAGTSAND